MHLVKRIVIVLLVTVTVAACGSGQQADADATETAESAVATSVAATIAAQQVDASPPTETPTPSASPTATEEVAIAATSTPTEPADELPESDPPTPTFTPTAAVEILAESDIDGDDGKDFLRSSSNRNDGRVMLLPTFGQAEVGDPMVFRDRLVMRIEVFDTREGEPFIDGNGIDQVIFIVEDSTGDAVYKRTERAAGYCVFGGGEPDCNILPLRANDSYWPQPDGGQTEIGGGPIDNDSYLARAVIESERGESTEWRWNFEIDIPGQHDDIGQDEPEQLPEVTLNVVQIGSSDGLVFEVFASAGEVNGDGIANVDLRLFAPDGTQLWQRTEGSEPYCLFSNEENSPCNRWNFAENDYLWPYGEEIISGLYRLTATANAEDGRSASIDETVEYTVDHGGSSGSGQSADLFATFSELQSQGALAVRVEAFDRQVGSNDGDGIEVVVIQIIDPSGQEVHRQREENAGYCAFGGSNPCEPWVFTDRSNQWPNGSTIQSGTYTIRAQVNTADGESTFIETEINVQDE